MGRIITLAGHVGQQVWCQLRNKIRAAMNAANTIIMGRQPCTITIRHSCEGGSPSPALTHFESEGPGLARLAFGSRLRGNDEIFNLFDSRRTNYRV
jgi:hypothetical protein